MAENIDTGELRRTIQKTFTSRCVYLAKDSLSYLVDYIKDLDQEQRLKKIGKIVEFVEKEEGEIELLELPRLKDIIEKSKGRTKTDESQLFKLENAFDWKRAVPDKSTIKDLVAEASRTQNAWKMLSFDCLRERYELIKAALDTEKAPICSIESLLSVIDERVQVLGMLSRGSGETMMAEDLTGSVRLDMGSAVYDAGLYFEGGIFLITGIHNSGILQVERISLPKLRKRSLLEPSAEAKGGSPNDRIVFLSDVLLDNPRVMKSIHGILLGFASCPPNVFVFCGRFAENQLAYGYTEAASTGFRHMANILSDVAAQYKETKFVLVPGAEDPSPTLVFPRAPLPPSVRGVFKDLPNVHFASNPCRLTFKGRSILIWRDDIVEKLCRSSLHAPSKAEDIPKDFCSTVWSQQHLSPLPLFLNPIMPHFDYLLHLWPMPDVVMLADKYRAFVVPASEQSALTLNPGSFPLSGFEFQVYYPSLGKVDSSSLEDGE